MEFIVAKVAMLISDSQIAINAGTDHGVATGSKVKLFRSVEVHDPDTKELLGIVNLVKLNLRVNHTQAKLCVASPTDIADGADDLSQLFKTSRSSRPRKTVSTNDSDETPGRVVLVKIGERVSIEVDEQDKEVDEESTSEVTI